VMVGCADGDESFISWRKSGMMDVEGRRVWRTTLDGAEMSVLELKESGMEGHQAV